MSKLKVMCLKKRYANFIHGKVYEAHSHVVIPGRNNTPADFYIIDEDGDRYPIASTKKDLKKNWKWVEEDEDGDN